MLLLTLIFIFLPRGFCSEFLRIETGHKQIAIDGRDPYLGYFTRIHLDAITCIQKITLHCLTPLTGAEEIDLLFSECPRGHWKVAHYSNMKEEFRLKDSVFAHQLIISSRRPLTIIDVQIGACTRKKESPVVCHDDDHQRRHGKGGPIKAKEYERTRRKRSLSTPLQLIYAEGSVTDISIDQVIPEGKTVVMYPGAVLRFANGIGMIVKGSIQVRGRHDSPVVMEGSHGKWKGLQIQSSSPSSILSHLNITGSDSGLSITGRTPKMENIIVEKNTKGISVNSTTDVSFNKTRSLNNEEFGFNLLGKVKYVLVSCIAAANKGAGILANGVQSLSIHNSTIMSNGAQGIYMKEAAQIEIRGTVIDGNNAGIRIQKHENIRMNFKLSLVNISGHHYGSAIQFNSAANSQIQIENCQIHDNYHGVMEFMRNTENSKINVADSNFTRNRGSVISIDNLSKGELKIEGTAFHSNQLNDYVKKEAVVVIHSQKNGSSVFLRGNVFTKNIMNDVILIQNAEGASTNNSITSNDFISNLARSVINIANSTALVRENFFHDVQATCELTLKMSSQYEKGRNMWGYDRQTEIDSRICSKNESIESENEVATEIQEQKDTIVYEENPLPNLQNTYNLIKALETPYTIDSEVSIRPDETVIVEPGTAFVFSPGVGVTVHERGKFIINGTADKKVHFSSRESTPWRGIVVKPGGSLYISNTVLSDASIALWLDSDRFLVEKVEIQRPVVHGVEVSANAGEIIDLGGSVVSQSMATAIAVDERKENIIISNAEIVNSGVSGIDFVSPSGHVTIENVKISGSGSHGIHISEYSTTPLQSVYLNNITVTEQLKGHSAVFINGGWIEEININNMTARNNIVPSLILALECDGKPSQTKISNSTFDGNEDTVISIELGECGNLLMKNNKMINNNNKNKKGGVLRVDGEPKNNNSKIYIDSNEFVGNTGEFVGILSSVGKGEPQGIFRNNNLEGNNVSDAVLVVTSAGYSINENIFANLAAKYEIEARGDGSWQLNATNNEWKGRNDSNIEEANRAQKGYVLFSPISTSLVVSTPSSMSPFAKCAHLNYCSLRGSCSDGICICPAGFTGHDCSVQFGCKDNCSTNGICNVFNVCVCDQGFSGSDCSIPQCEFDCGNHGKCIGKDKCNCEEKWTGQFCLNPACSSTTCIHGACEDKKCNCHSGWRGENCDIPHCSSCSLNGVCVSPEECQCLEGYGGEDCSKCVSCNECDLDCDHGVCQPNTRTCECVSGWTGAACDVCPTVICPATKGEILYILPPNADKNNNNTVVTIFTKDIPRSKTQDYACIFGTSTTKAVRISSKLMRCRVPTNMSVVKHIFNVVMDGNVVATSKPLHFTFFDKCIPSVCGGTCMGPLCICPVGRTGNNCDIIELLPEIDNKFLHNQAANSAVEGTPYVVYLPTLPNVMLHVNSSIADLHFDPLRGILEWAEPIGNELAQTITVTADSLAGKSEVSWQIQVDPSYTAKIEDVLSKGNYLSLKGGIKGNKSLESLPVVIEIFENGKKVEEKTEKTEKNGAFTLDFIPARDAKYTFRVKHPGRASFDDEKSIAIEKEDGFTIGGEGDKKVLEINKKLQDCQVITLKGKADSDVTSDASSTKVAVELQSKDAILKISCNNFTDILRLTNENIEVPSSDLWSTPQSLIFYQNTKEILSPITQLLIHTSELQLSSPVAAKSNGNAVLLVSTDPPLKDYRKYGKGGKDLLISLKMNVSTALNSSIVILSNNQELLRIPFSILPSSPRHSNSNVSASICLRDEWNENEQKRRNVASVSLVNQQMKVFASQNNVDINGEPSHFTLSPGIYDITVTSPFHRKLKKTVEISIHNSSFCLDLQSNDGVIPARKSQEWTLTTIYTKASVPYLEFSASIMSPTTAEVLVTVRSEENGTFIPKDIKTEYGTYTSTVHSVGSNESFWMTFSPTSSAAACGVNTVQIPFGFVPEFKDTVLDLSSTLLLGNNSSEDICDESGSKVSTGLVSTISCDCSEDARSKCRDMYQSAAACGPTWKSIADDTVSLQTMMQFLKMKVQCEQLNINFSQLIDTLECVSSIESNCPLSHRLKRADPESGPASIINHISTINGVGFVFPSQLNNIFNAIDMQSIALASIYKQFFQQMQKVFPPSLVKELDGKTMGVLISLISEMSEDGLSIAKDESTHLNSDVATTINDTVHEWTMGKWSHEEKGIRYSEVKELVRLADRLKSFTRQNGGSDPFTLLHEYMGKLLSSTGKSRNCALATVLIDPEEISEGDAIDIQIMIKNINQDRISSISLDLDIEREEATAPSAHFVSNGIAVNTLPMTNSLDPGSTAMAKWPKRVVLDKKLTSSSYYQIILVASFMSEGKWMKQRVETRRVLVRPTDNVKIVYLLQPSLNEEHPFSAMVSVMNVGYSTLRKVKVDSMDISVVDEKSKACDFYLNSVGVDGKNKGSTMKFELGGIASGASKTLTLNVTGIEKSRLSSVRTFISAEQSGLHIDDSDTYIIRSILGVNGKLGLLVSLPNSDNLLFFFKPQSGTIVNIIPLQSVAEQSKTIKEPDGTIVVAVFKNTESKDFVGYLWGSINIPELKNGWELVKMEEKAANQGRDRQLQPITWIEEKEGKRRLNFIDSGIVSANYHTTYSFLFTDPLVYSIPTFDQISYRIQLVPEKWPTVGGEVGQIEAEMKENNEKIKYELYSPDDTEYFSVDENTGRIFLSSEVPLGGERCLILVAKDSKGQQTRVPLAINTGGIRGECMMFPTNGLNNQIHKGPLPDVTTQTSATEIYTRPTTTEEPLPTPPTLPDVEETTEIYTRTSDEETTVTQEETTITQEETTVTQEEVTLSPGTVTVITRGTSDTTTVEESSTTDKTEPTSEESTQTETTSIPTKTTTEFIHTVTSDPELSTIDPQTWVTEESTATKEVTTAAEGVTETPIVPTTNQSGTSERPEDTTMTTATTAESTTEEELETVYTHKPDDMSTLEDVTTEVTVDISTVESTWSTEQVTLTSTTEGSIDTDFPHPGEITTPGTTKTSDGTTETVIYTVTPDSTLQTVTEADLTTEIVTRIDASTVELTDRTTESVTRIDTSTPEPITETSTSTTLETSTYVITSDSELDETTAPAEITLVTIGTAGATDKTPPTPLPSKSPPVSDACRKASLPIWNLICQLSKSVTIKTKR